MTTEIGAKGSPLAALAAAHGVATEYDDWIERRRQVPAATVRAVLGAMGVAARTDEEVATAIAAARAAPSRRLLPPSVVVRDDRAAAVTVNAPRGARIEASLRLEAGAAASGERPVTLAPRGRDEDAATLPLPEGLPLGYHILTVHVEDGGETAHAEALVVVAPARCPLPPHLQRQWGWMLQLYQLRSTESWGIGDLGDLAAIARWSGGLGAGLLLCNPLHAASPGLPQEASPYYPSSRRFTNPLYLRIADLPEVDGLDAGARARLAELDREAMGRNTSERVDRDEVYPAKSEALELLFAVPRSPERAAAFDRYRAQEGQGLVDFATFCALAERHGTPWQSWPDELRHPASPAVARARRELAGRVAYHVWVQWLCDEQLAAAQAAATGAGMAVGVVHDLAVGVDAGGADAWALQDDLAIGMTVGAPPDGFNQQGQDWRLPPLRPDRLAATGYAPFRDMLRSVLRHAGGIRIDHVMGMFRLWWVPEGQPPSAGTYVSYPSDELLGVLALEAHRADAVVVGEDLGTVENVVRETLADRAVFGSRVLYFERNEDDDAFLPPRAYPRLALASVTTHDLPTAHGWWADEELRVRDELRLLRADTAISAERRRKNRERAELVDALRAEGLVGTDPSTDELVLAMHAFLARTPSLLVAAGLAEAVGDPRQPNLPGTTDEYPSWRLPLAERRDGEPRPLLLDELFRHPGARRLADALRR